MPPAAHSDAAGALLGVAPLVSRWMERLLAAHEPPLTSSQLLVLRAVASEPVSVSDLARRAGVSGPAVSQLLSGLVAAGLVARRTDPADRRRHELVLSSSGQSVLRSAETLLRGRLGALLGDLPRPEADALTRLLVRVEAILGVAPPPSLPPRPPVPPSRHGPRGGPG